MHYALTSASERVSISCILILFDSELFGLPRSLFFNSLKTALISATKKHHFRAKLEKYEFNLI